MGYQRVTNIYFLILSLLIKPKTNQLPINMNTSLKGFLIKLYDQ